MGPSYPELILEFTMEAGHHGRVDPPTYPELK